MADLAQAALNCVFEKHAGFLKSYEADGFKRLMAAARISERMRTEVSLAWKKYNPSDGNAGIFEFVGSSVTGATTKLMRLAPEYVDVKYRRMDCTIYEVAVEVLGAFDRYIQERLRETEWERIQQAVRLQLEFRQELDAIHMLGQPAWTFSIDYSYCNFVDTATGNSTAHPPLCQAETHPTRPRSRPTQHIHSRRL